MSNSPRHNFSFFIKEQLSLFKKLNTPQKVQDFLETLKANFGETNMSPKKVLEKKKAHCFEGALLAAAILRFHGHKPLIVDLKTTHNDDDHILAVFKQHGHWGAITKTNHAVLRYRDPIFKSIRELVVSYFNEYFLADGRKSLRSYSRPINLSKFDKFNWMTTEKNLQFIADAVDQAPHIQILNKKMISLLRRADSFERKVFESVQFRRKYLRRK